MREQALLLRTTVVQREFVHLFVANDHRNIEVTHLRQLDGLLDQVAHPLALQVDALEPVVDLLLAGSFLLGRRGVHLYYDKLNIKSTYSIDYKCRHLSLLKHFI